MTKAVRRKSGKKGRSEDVKTISTVRPSAKFHKRQHEHQEETSRRWIIWLIILCLLIGAVVVIFIPAFQFTSKEVGKNFDQSKKVKEVEPKDDRARASDGRKENDAGKTSCSCFFNLICDVVSMPRKHKKEEQASDIHDLLLQLRGLISIYEDAIFMYQSIPKPPIPPGQSPGI